ncbi:MAG: MFS transporter [Magnetococcales bacterium]|nr:MFS transporter [Magnetococcales bacterium]
MRRKASTGIIFITVFADLLGFGMVLPLMPLYASDPRFLAAPWQIGWLMAIYSLMQFLFAPFWGRISDRWGRRPVLIVGLFGSCISYLVYGMAGSLWLLFVARGVAGIMGANIAAAQAAMADITPPEKRAQAMGLIGAAFSLGFVLGPAMGGLLSQYGLEAAPLAAAAITGLNGLAAIFFLAETKNLQTAANSKPAPRYHPLSLQPWREARAYPGALAVCFLMGGFITLFSAFEVTLPLWGQELMGWTMATTGWVFAYVGVMMAISQGGLVRRLAPRVGEKRTARMGLVLVSAGLGILGLIGGWVGTLGGLALVALGAGLVHPGFSSLVSLNTTAEKQGVMMGLFQSMSALGRVIGPVVGGLLYEIIQGKLFIGVALGIVGIWLLLKVSAGKVRDARESAPQSE